MLFGTGEGTSNVWRLFYQDEKYTYLITDELVGSYKPSDYYDNEENQEKYKDGTKMSTVGQKLNTKVSSLFMDENNKANENIRATVWFTDTTNDLWTKYKDENGDAEFCIASPTAAAVICTVNVGFFDFDVYVDYSSCAVRPIVCILTSKFHDKGYDSEESLVNEE